MLHRSTMIQIADNIMELVENDKELESMTGKEALTKYAKSIMKTVKELDAQGKGVTLN